MSPPRCWLVGGAHGALVTAVSLRHSNKPSICCDHAARCRWLASAGQDVAVHLPHRHKRITVRGSIVGTRQDLEEALTFARRWCRLAHFSWDRLENINEIFASMEDGRIDGRIVVKMQ